MSKAASRLDGGLIARKGEATPSTVTVIEPLSSKVEVKPISVPSPSAPVETSTPKGVAGTIAVTVRLDPSRYERLKIHGAKQRQTNQQIIVAALDAYL